MALCSPSLSGDASAGRSRFRWRRLGRPLGLFYMSAASDASLLGDFLGDGVRRADLCLPPIGLYLELGSGSFVADDANPDPLRRDLVLRMEL